MKYVFGLFAALLLTLRGTPFLYQGQEIGMRNGDFRTVEDFEDLNTHDQYQAARSAGRTEEEAMAVCRRHSRDNARTPMQWTGGGHAGFTTGTPWQATVTVPREAVGTRVTGAVTSTHWVTILLQPLSSPGQGRMAACS